MRRFGRADAGRHRGVSAVSIKAGTDGRADAREAYEVGRAAADPVERRRWLDRAHRLLPGDPTLRLALAEALLGCDDARAEALLLPLSRRFDRREVWLALAASRWAQVDSKGAGEALARALSGHAMLASLAGFADAVVAAAGRPGWCGMQADGELAVRSAHPVLIERGHAVRVTVDGRDLFGSPLALHALKRVEGWVEETPEGGLRGWAWMPANPDIDPVLTIEAAKVLPLRLTADTPEPAHTAGLLARRRSFAVTAARLAGLGGPVRVRGGDGRDLLGSPVRVRPAAAPGPIRTARRAWDGGIDVIIPVHGGTQASLDCIASVLASRPAPTRLLVVDDATPEHDLAAALDALAAEGRITLIRHRASRGFPCAANAGLRRAAAAGRDAVLLNADTLVPPGWLGALRACAHAARDVGTVTPLSNSAGIVSHPGPDGTNPTPDLASTIRLDRLARRANGAAVTEIPVGVGFCLYIRLDCLVATGLLREDVFAQGYGEENDFCLRAAALGWRHVAASGVFVGHVGGASFGGAAEALRARNGAVLERLHPGYAGQVARFIAADPLAHARRRIDRLAFRASRPPACTGAVLMVTHDQGGGVERVIAGRAAAARAAGLRPLVLRPARAPDGRLGARLAEAGTDEACPNLLWAVPDELPEFRRDLASEKIVRVELHHLLGHAPDILDLPALLRVPYDVHVHDYAWLCARVVLLGASGRYCGEPDIAGCDACVRAAGSLLDEPITPAALRERSARVLAGAARVVVPTADAAHRMARHFPGVVPEIVAHDPSPYPLPQGEGGLLRTPSRGGDGDLRIGVPPPLAGGGRGRGGPRARIAVIGALGAAKGYDVLLACAEDAERRALPLDFVVVGHTIDDERLMRTRRVFVTGPYAVPEAESLIRAQDAAIAFIPSVVPETWCFALSEAWGAGLRTVAFDLGAQAERIRAAGLGTLLAPGDTPSRINDVLLAACLVSRHEEASPVPAATGSRWPTPVPPAPNLTRAQSSRQRANRPREAPDRTG